MEAIELARRARARVKRLLEATSGSDRDLKQRIRQDPEHEPLLEVLT